MNGPKIIPLAKTPKLGKIIKGNKNFLGKKVADKNKQALTIIPTNHCGCPKEKGIAKDKIEIQLKIKIWVEANRFTGKLIDKTF